jgi:acyl dehydratase
MPEQTTQPGWTGRCFEDFAVGHVYEHRLGRTITSADNIWFTLLTLNTNPVHFNHDYASRTEFGRPLVNSCLTLSLVTGMSVPDVSQNAFANLGWDEVRLPHPVFEGDTLYARSEVLAARPSSSRPDVGIIRIKTTGYNQDGVAVIEFERSIMVYRRGHLPAPPRRPGLGQGPG